MQREFKGVWIPKEIWLSKDLKTLEKVMLAEIDSLDNENGCYASNKYFAEFFDLSPNRVSEIISKLADKKFISISYEFEGKRITKRVIRVFGKSNRGIRNSDEGYSENRQGYSENSEDNNIFNNTLNNISPSQETSKISKKISYAEFVKMKEEDYKKLLEQYGEAQTKKMIETLDNYIGAKGKDPYKNHYRAILSWVVEKVGARSTTCDSNKSGSKHRDVTREELDQIIL